MFRMGTSFVIAGGRVQPPESAPPTLPPSLPPPPPPSSSSLSSLSSLSCPSSSEVYASAHPSLHGSRLLSYLMDSPPKSMMTTRTHHQHHHQYTHHANANTHQPPSLPSQSQGQTHMHA